MSKETRQFEKKEQTARKEPENFRTRSKRTREGLHTFEGPRGRKAAKGQRAHEGAKARAGHADREGREACEGGSPRGALSEGRSSSPRERRDSDRTLRTGATAARLHEALSRSAFWFHRGFMCSFCLRGPLEAPDRAQLNRWGHLGSEEFRSGLQRGHWKPCLLKGRLVLVMETWRGRRKTRARERRPLLDTVHVGGDTNNPMDKAGGFLRTLSMHAREAVERRAYPGQRKSLSDSTQKTTYGDQQKTQADLNFACRPKIASCREQRPCSKASCNWPKTSNGMSGLGSIWEFWIL